MEYGGGWITVQFISWMGCSHWCAAQLAVCCFFLCKRICEGLCGTSPLKTRVGSSVRRCQSQWASGTAWRGRWQSFWSRRILSFQEGREIKTRLQSLWVQMCTESPHNSDTSSQINNTYKHETRWAVSHHEMKSVYRILKIHNVPQLWPNEPVTMWFMF